MNENKPWDLNIFELNIDFIKEAQEDRYPKIGPFYYYQNRIIAPDEYQRKINPITKIIESFLPMTESAIIKEHRDMWDNYMLKQYPELKINYDDDHKALPRGRVDINNKEPLSFYVTLDKCIKDMEDDIKRIYNLLNHTVKFNYGTMNYKCKNCNIK